VGDGIIESIVIIGSGSKETDIKADEIAAVTEGLIPVVSDSIDDEDEAEVLPCIKDEEENRTVVDIVTIVEVVDEGSTVEVLPCVEDVEDDNIRAVDMDMDVIVELLVEDGCTTKVDIDVITEVVDEDTMVEGDVVMDTVLEGCKLGVSATLVVVSIFTSELVVLSLSSLLEDVTKIILEEEADVVTNELDVAMVTTGVLEATSVEVVVGDGCITEVVVVGDVTDGSNVEDGIDVIVELLEGGNIVETDEDMGTIVEDDDIIGELEDSIMEVVVDMDVDVGAIIKLDVVDIIIEELDDCIGEVDITIILDDVLVDTFTLVDNWVGVGVILGLEMTDIGGPV